MEELKKSMQGSENKDVSFEQKEEHSNSDTNLKQKKNILQTIRVWFRNLTKRQKIAVISGGVLITMLLLSSIALLFKIDAIFFPSSISGNIIDVDSGKGLEGALVCVKNDCTTSAENGYYVLGNLVYGEAEVKISLTNYHTITQLVSLKRGRSEYNFTLTPTGYGNLAGTLKSNMEEYDYSSVTMLLDEEPVTVDQNGSFHLNRIPVGSYKLLIQSPDFKDAKIDVVIDENLNDLGSIDLVAAGDIIFKISDRLNGQLIKNADIIYQKISKSTNAKGEAKLKDILPGKIKVKLSAEGYLDKSVSAIILQGDNETKSVNIIKTGRVVYVSNRLGNNNVYISNYDGSGEKLLSDNVGDSTSPYLSSDGSTVYFLSTRDFVKSSNGYSNINLVYSVPSAGGPITKVSQTQYKDNDSIGSYSFESKKRAYVKMLYVPDPWYITSEVFFGNINGTDMQSLGVIKGYVSSVMIANDGSFIVYSLQSHTHIEKNGVYYMNTTSKESTMIMQSNGDTVYPADISSNRTMVLVRRYSKDQAQWDVWIAGITERYEVQLTNTSAGEEQAMFSPDSSKITYVSNRDGKHDLYMIGVDGQSEIKLTNDGIVDEYFWGVENRVFFISKKTMWVIDTVSTQKPLMVSEQVGGTYYTSHYYYD